MKNPIDLLNQFTCYRVQLFSTFTQDSEKLKVKNQAPSANEVQR